MGGWMDWWIAILCPFQHYVSQDDGRMIMKGCVQLNPVYGWEISPPARLELGTARSVGQRETQMSKHSGPTTLKSERNVSNEHILPL